MLIFEFSPARRTAAAQITADSPVPNDLPELDGAWRAGDAATALAAA
jgi:hypothetical protein